MANTSDNAMNILEVMRHLPHRYPFLLIDRVIDVELNKHATALKNVTINEPYFNGHFPQQPIMPGVLIIEAMAQVTGVLSFLSTNTRPDSGENYFLAGVNAARFKRIVEPGDQLTIRVELLKKKRDIGQFNCTAHVGDQLVCAADLLTARRKADA